MFFVAVAGIDDALKGLKKFLSYYQELWPPMKSFRKKVERYKTLLNT